MDAKNFIHQTTNCGFNSKINSTSSNDLSNNQTNVPPCQRLDYGQFNNLYRTDKLIGKGKIFKNFKDLFFQLYRNLLSFRSSF